MLSLGIYSSIATYELRNLQIFLDGSLSEYLDHDSYLDCSFLKEFSLTELKRRYSADITIFLGHLSEADLQKAREKVIGAKTIPPKIKKKFDLMP